MYYIIDLEKDPHSAVEGISFTDQSDACLWIEENGGIVRYTIIWVDPPNT
jgi:hypothetical protein